MKNLLVILFTFFSATALATITASPSTFTVCVGSGTTLSCSLGGGTWISSNTSVATIASFSGGLNGISPGTATITYQVVGSPGTYEYTTITVTPAPGPITGTLISGVAHVCPDFTTTLSNSTAGGAWTVVNSSIATVNSSGVVTGVTTGSTRVSYTTAPLAACKVGITVSVNTNTAAISPFTATGIYSLCLGATVNLTGATSGGTWTSSDPSVATIDASGLVTSVSAPTYLGPPDNNPNYGTSTITYALSANCKTTKTVRSFPLPGSPVPTTGYSVCIGDSIRFYPDQMVYGHSSLAWTSNDEGILLPGMISEAAPYKYISGNFTGISAGTVTITFTANNWRNNCISTANVTVYQGLPDITGSSSICVGSTTTLSNSTTGGTWASSNTSVATVNSSTGVVTAVAAGTALLTYKVSPSLCETYKTITVLALPATISGPSVVCVGSGALYTDATSGGTWSSSNTGVLTINSSTGVATGVATGTATITYTAASGCYKTQSITINGAVNAITGTASACEGATSTLSDATGGGTWSSSNTAVCTISSGGVVNAISAGTSTISYITSTGCYSTVVFTVYAQPGAISGSTTVCAGANTTLGNTVTGGTWSSSNTGVLTINSSTGVATGVAAGTSTVTYTASGGCYSTATITVYNAPASIMGPLSACEGDGSALGNATGGGTWSSSNTLVCTISSVSDHVGELTAISAGTSVITYTLPTGCYTTTVYTVYAQPGDIIGATTVCVGAPANFADVIEGGTWSSSNSGILSIDPSTGEATGVSAGTAMITYTTEGGCYATLAVNVTALPNAGTISNDSTVCIGSAITLTASGDAGGAWSSSNTSVATVDATGEVTGISAGSATISYIVTNGCGSDTATADVTVELCCLTNSVTISTGYDPLTHSLIGGRPGEGGAAAVVDDPKWVVSAISADAIAAIAVETGFIAIPVSHAAGIADLIEPWAYSANSNWITAQNAHGYHTSAPGDYSMTLSRPFKMCAEDDIRIDVEIADDNYISAADVDGTPVSLTQIPYSNYGNFVHYTPVITLPAGSHVLNITVSNHDYGHTMYNLTGLNVNGKLISVTHSNSLVREDNEACSSYSCAAEKHAAASTPDVLNQTELIKGFPNPSQGAFTLKGVVANAATKEVSIEVTDILGNTLLTDVAATKDGAIDKKITLGNNIANGTYLVKVRSKDTIKVFRIVLNR